MWLNFLVLPSKGAMISISTILISTLVLRSSKCLENVALNKPTEQVSTTQNTRARWVVDGNTGGSFSDDGCAMTSPSDLAPDSWWAVDLQGIYHIEYVRIFTRTDCCSDLLRDFNVLAIHDDLETIELCTAVLEIVPIGGKTYHCNKPVKGRFVKIKRRNHAQESLTLCEVEVFGRKIGEIINVENYALNKPIRHSQAELLSISSRAVDGIYDYSKAGTLRLSYGTNLHWVIIDMQTLETVGRLRFAMDYNQFVADASRDVGTFMVAVTTEDPETLDGFPDATAETSTICRLESGDPITSIKFDRFPEYLSCEKPVTGRYVWIVLKTPNPSQLFTVLTISNIEVGPVLHKAGKVSSWRLSLVYQKGSQSVINESSSLRHMSTCARKGIEERKVNNGTLFIQVDLPNGECHFLVDEDERNQSESSNWVVYQLIGGER